MAELRLTQMREAFKFFDRNNDGQITIEGLSGAMKYFDRNITESELQDMIRESDVEGKGTVDFVEFCMLMEFKLEDIDSEGDMREAFRAFDMDRDGFISEAELRHIMHNLGGNLTDEEAAEMIREADTDGDGRVSYEEFKRIMQCI